MKILVTGAAGFIGVNLCQRLLDDGNEVIGMDNFYCSREEKIQHLRDKPRFSFVAHDITQSFIPIEHQLQNIHAICNLACPASPIQYLKDPVYTTKVSVFGILNVLDLATKLHVPILQASTSEVYGDPLEHPQTESYWGNVNPTGIRACYDEGKRVAESFCFDYHRQYNTKIKIIRIFNTYGPYMEGDDGRVISNFITQALKKIPLTIYGNGEQTRSFCYVDDLVDGITEFLFLSGTQKHITGPINLGNPHEMTIHKLAEKIKARIADVQFEYKALPENDPKVRKPDITMAQELLDWNPNIQLDTGLDHTITWFTSSIV